MDAKFLDKLKKNSRLDMPDLIKKLINGRNKVLSYPIFEPWIDIGTHTIIIKKQSLKN